MPISIRKAALLFALAKSEENGGKEVAVGFNLGEDEGGPVIGINANEAITPNDSQSAIINLLQGIKNESGGEVKYVNFIATSMEPTIKSIGMAKMQGVKRIFYLKDNGDITVINCEKPPFKSAKFNSDSKEVYVDLTDIPLPIRENAKDWYDRIKKKDPKETAPFWISFQNAKEYSRFTTGPDFKLPEDLIRPDGREDTDLRHDIFMKLAWAIVGEASTQRGLDPSKYLPGHNIGSVLRGPSDEILAWGINTNEGNATLHGEVNLIQNYHRNRTVKTMDSNAILYSTLEPCHMCAAMYAESGQNLKCFFGQKDPGIKDNALEQKKFNSSQDLREEGLGKITTSALKSQLKIVEHNDQESKTITDLLNKIIKPLIQHAIYDYFDLGKKIKDGSPEKTIWENGYKLLVKINPKVNLKRQAHEQRKLV